MNPYELKYSLQHNLQRIALTMVNGSLRGRLGDCPPVLWANFPTIDYSRAGVLCSDNPARNAVAMMCAFICLLQSLVWVIRGGGAMVGVVVPICTNDDDGCLTVEISVL